MGMKNKGFVLLGKVPVNAWPCDAAVPGGKYPASPSPLEGGSVLSRGAQRPLLGKIRPFRSPAGESTVAGQDIMRLSLTFLFIRRKEWALYAEQSAVFTVTRRHMDVCNEVTRQVIGPCGGRKGARRLV